MMDAFLPAQTPDRPVLVVGAAGMDMIGLVQEPLQSGSANPANIRVSFGGVARNIAENLARLGQPVRLLTAVGGDIPGQHMLSYTAGCGVQMDGCFQSEIHHTGSYLAILDQAGSRYLTLEDMAILEEITPAYLLKNQAIIRESSILFMDANLSPASMEALFALAAEAKIPVGADTTSRLLARKLLPYLEKLSIVTANSAEASMLCSNDPVVTDRDSGLLAARRLVNQGVELAVVSLAEFGVVYATSETSGHIPAVSTNIVDPTGAGDALTATIIFGLLNDIPIDEAVRLGVTAASLILRYRGTVLPGLSLEKLYDELVT